MGDQLSDAQNAGFNPYAHALPHQPCNDKRPHPGHVWSWGDPGHVQSRWCIGADTLATNGQYWTMADVVNRTHGVEHTLAYTEKMLRKVIDDLREEFYQFRDAQLAWNDEHDNAKDYDPCAGDSFVSAEKRDGPNVRITKYVIGFADATEQWFVEFDEKWVGTFPSYHEALDYAELKNPRMKSLDLRNT